MDDHHRHRHRESRPHSNGGWGGRGFEAGIIQGLFPPVFSWFTNAFIAYLDFFHRFAFLLSLHFAYRNVSFRLARYSCFISSTIVKGDVYDVEIRPRLVPLCAGHFEARMFSAGGVVLVCWERRTLGGWMKGGPRCECVRREESTTRISRYLLSRTCLLFSS
jgi:hypothetical protein